MSELEKVMSDTLHFMEEQFATNAIAQRDLLRQIHLGQEPSITRPMLFGVNAKLSLVKA